MDDIISEAISSVLPTENEVLQYERDGYYISRPLFSENIISSAMHGIERYYRGERDFAISMMFEDFEGWKPGDKDKRRLNDYAMLCMKELKALLTPTLGAIAGRLARTDSIRLWHDQLINKTPSTNTGIGWHTDKEYWPTCSSSKMLTAFIPLNKHEDNMGPLMFVEGSHLWSEQSSHRSFHSTKVDRLIHDQEQVRIKKVQVQPGCISFHHCRTIHGSDANLSHTNRVAVAVHLQDAGNKYTEWKYENGKPAFHQNDALCSRLDGLPNYSDPDIFPEIWRRVEG